MNCKKNHIVKEIKILNRLEIVAQNANEANRCSFFRFASLI